MKRSTDPSSRTRSSATVALGTQSRDFSQSSASAATAASPTWLEWLERCYELSDSATVVTFLEQHPFLIPVLSDAFVEIQRVFEPGDILRLEVVQDRESLARQLYVIVRTSLSPEAAYRRLDRLDNEWWLNALDAARGALTIDVEPH